ncbi:MAG: 50S ribosomal protein L17 [Bacteroidota bacterium]
MRHGKKINHLGRTSSHRKAMLANMASSLILHKRINTTTAKAKALKKYVEPLITKAKQDNTHSRRMVFSYLQDKVAVSELFRDVVEKVGERPGGYTRILKTGNRNGDNAEMCFLELVDYNETYTSTEEKQTTSRRRRRRRGGKKKSQSQQKAEETSAQSDEEDTQQKPQDEVGEQSVDEEKQESQNIEGSEDQQPKDESAKTQQKDSEDEENKGEEENRQSNDSEEDKKEE